MGFFVVCMLKEAKTIVSDKVVKVLLTDCFQFHDIFDLATNNQFESLGDIQVFLRKPPEKWVYVEEGLQGDVSMLFELNFTHIKFILEATETRVQERPNAFDFIMETSQRICLPEKKKKVGPAKNYFIMILLDYFKVNQLGGKMEHITLLERISLNV